MGQQASGDGTRAAGRSLDQIGEKYSAKKPKNSIAVLEKYILSGMNTVDAQNYYEKITGDMLRAQSGDVFLQRRNELRHLLFNQCQVIASRQVETNYRALKSFFDENLAGKFPFADIEPGRIGYEEADPEQIKAFYELFNTSVPTIKSVLDYNRNFGRSGQQAARFIADMETVGTFFSTYLAAEEENAKDEKAVDEKEKVPALGLEVTFRVNQGREVMANQIMGWKLAVGKQSFVNGGQTAAGQWELGKPVAVFLRWAKNAPYKPVFAGAYEGAVVKGRTAAWRFTNSWSLLRLLSEHAADKTDLHGFKDKEPHTLKFEVDVDRVDGKEPTGRELKTRAFLRIALMTADKARQPLRVPRFPTSAPKLGMLVAVEGD